MLPKPALRAAAARLLDADPACVALTPLPGGRNNRVYRVAVRGREPVVLKHYHWSEQDQRDRLDREWRFLAYAWDRGVRAVPRPIAQDRAARIGIYAALPGRRPWAEEIAAWHIDAAADFVVALNAPPRDPRALPPGAEACFTLSDHLSLIDRRVHRLCSLDRDAPHGDEAARFVRNLLVPAWDAVRARVEEAARALGIAPDAPPGAAAFCVSPSDFGFHNALEDAGALFFVDFEYAGQDDAAKLVCDFFCQPELPVPEAHRARFLSRVADGLGLDEAGRARCLLLLDAYRIKWTCIVMNEFLPAGAARRAFAASGARAAAPLAQLAKARHAIDGLKAARA